MELPKAPSELFHYACEVLKWIDADTLDVDIDLGFEVHLMQRVRVYGLNTPEIHSADMEEKKNAIKALNFATLLAPLHSKVKIQTHKAEKEREKYGRWLADITLENGADFASRMIEEKHGCAYFGGKR